MAIDYYTKWNLQQHIKEVHLKLKPFACNKCEQAFTRNHDLKRHTSKRHSSTA